jgi:uncharacterized damage-inducible protein DinB
MSRVRPPVIPETDIPQTVVSAWQHAVDTYASETNKVADVWSRFTDADLGYRPHVRSSSVEDVLRHQLLSERRFFAEFLGLADAPAVSVLPAPFTVASAIERLGALARPRLTHIAGAAEGWWLEPVRFFDVTRPRAWIFWRRLLHTAHHRTQLTIYLRLLDRPVPAVYGPSADESWEGADPTTDVASAGRTGA